MVNWFRGMFLWSALICVTCEYKVFVVHAPIRGPVVALVPKSEKGITAPFSLHSPAGPVETTQEALQVAAP